MGAPRFAQGHRPPQAESKPDNFASVVALGDYCRHYGTKEWAAVTEIHPRGPNSAELVLRDDIGELRFWATYHVDYYVPAARVPELPPLVP